MKDLISKMKMIEIPHEIIIIKDRKIICPICNNQVFENTQDPELGIHFEKVPREEICEHISAFVEISDFDLENVPLFPSRKQWEVPIFEAEICLPGLSKDGINGTVEFKKFLEERKPDYVIKVEDKSIKYKWHFFFKSEGFGFFDE